VLILTRILAARRGHPQEEGDKTMHVFFPKWARVGVACIALWAGPGAAQTRHNPSLEALGSQIFLDRSLSADGSVSCASCHRPDHSFADDLPVRAGAGGVVGHRNAPSLLNAPLQDVFFWDGRVIRFDAAVMEPFFQHAEMGLASEADLARKIRNSGTLKAYEAAYGTDTPVTKARLARALAAYLKDKLASPRHDVAVNVGTAAAARGASVFQNKAGCGSCHSGVTFTDNQFHPAGIGMNDISANLPALLTKTSAISALPRDIGNAVGGDPGLSRLGRFMVSRRASELGMFRTPSLIHVGETAPYMHDGSVPTLEEAVDREIYWRSLATGEPLALTKDERTDLVAFLRSLASVNQSTRGFTQSNVPPAASTAARAAVTSVPPSATKRTVIPLKPSLGSSL
jgi:cytochrome c peroxidase